MCLVSACALAGAPESESGRIKAERAAAAAKFEAQERDCQARFAVTPCVDAARKEQRATLARLHRQEGLLDEARRRDAAAVRGLASRDKAAAQEAKASDTARSDEGKGARKSPRPATPNPPRAGASKPATGGSSISPADQRLIEQQNEAKFEARARAAQAHREAVELRNAERAAQGKVAKPLPVPAGASAP
jgi:hypothetical protein